MQTLFDIRKRTEYASYEKHVDDASKAPGANKHANHAAKTALGFKICNSECAPVTAQASRQKDQPRHFNRRQKTHPTPRKQIYIGRDMRQCEPNTHISSMRDGQKNCVSIDRQNCFTKSVKQARKNIWARRKTPLRASAWAVACYGTLFANMRIICEYIEMIWLVFRSILPILFPVKHTKIRDPLTIAPATPNSLSDAASTPRKTDVIRSARLV